MNGNDHFVELSNGVKVPILGLGTSHYGGYCHSTLVYALRDCGYRLVDTAKRYGCEEFIGNAIKESGVPRENIFLTTKLWPSGYGTQTSIETCKSSMKRLQTDYLDLYLMHWPLCRSEVSNANQVLEETWRSLEKLYDDGVCHAIGVSNYQIDDLEHLLENCSIHPHVNQVEFHPYNNNRELRQFCRENKIQYEGHCPLAKGKILDENVILEIAKKYNKTPAQVLIRWSVQNQVITIPKSTKISRVKENMEVLNFELSADCMNMLDFLPCTVKALDDRLISRRLTRKLFT